MKTSHPPRRSIAAITQAVLLICVGLCSASALAETYRVVVDTNALNGTNGFLDFQLNPANLSAPSGAAQITDFIGSVSLLSAPLIEGNVAGLLPGAITLANSTPFNDYFQSVQFGNSFSFTLDFSGDFLSLPSLSGTSFALSLYGADAVTPLLTTDVSGSVLRFELAASNATFETFPATIGGAPIVQVAPVPLPAAAWLLLSGVIGLARMARRKT